jgi:hypothetical protein
MIFMPKGLLPSIGALVGSVAGAARARKAVR